MDGVYFMKNPMKMDDLGGPPLFLETSFMKMLMEQFWRSLAGKFFFWG